MTKTSYMFHMMIDGMCMPSCSVRQKTASTD